MKSKWRKLGLLFFNRGVSPELQTHSSTPFAHQLDEHLFRVYFSARDKNNRSSIGTFDFDMRKPMESVRVHASALLNPGPRGSFDSCGVSMGSMIQKNNELWLYYLGWDLKQSVPWQNSIGLAVSTDGNKFKKVSSVPVLDRNPHDPFTMSYPWVLQDEGQMKMWYGTNLSWGPTANDMQHAIRLATSADGLSWEPTDHLIPPIGPIGLSRPCVLKNEGNYTMWVSIREMVGYRIAQFSSKDGRSWLFTEDKVLNRGPEEWDNSSVSYTHVFTYQGRLHMLYNGNDYGKSGIGLAISD